MSNTTQTYLLNRLSKEIKEYDKQAHRLLVHETDKLYNLYYQTIWHNDYSENGRIPLFSILSDKSLSPYIKSIKISSEDYGINGTQAWDLATLLQNNAFFKVLDEFHLPLNERETHNRKIVTYNDSYEESGALGLLIKASPNLQKLSASSAPNELFFERDAHPLKELNIQSGYNTQNFIKKLAHSKCFSKLETFIFRDYAEDYMNDYKDLCVKFEEYKLLFESTNLHALKNIIIYDCILSENEKRELLTMNKEINLSFKEL